MVDVGSELVLATMERHLAGLSRGVVRELVNREVHAYLGTVHDCTPYVEPPLIDVAASEAEVLSQFQFAERAAFVVMGDDAVVTSVSAAVNDILAEPGVKDPSTMYVNTLMSMVAPKGCLNVSAAFVMELLGRPEEPLSLGVDTEYANVTVEAR